MTRRRWWIAGAVLLLVGAGAAGRYWYTRDTGIEVTTEALYARDLEAIVSATGTIQPQRQVNVSANTMGRVTRLAVREGERVKAGQFLLEIDPRSLAGQLQRGEAGVAAARSALAQSRTGVEQARATLDLARQTLRRQQELWRDGLIARDTLERAENDVAVREAELRNREQEVQTREEQIRQEQASLATTRYNLSQVIIASPMDGLVTRRNIEEGETAVVGTMNNAGTVLLTIADMSVVQAEVEVDETDIPTVAVGQVARVSIDAVPDRTFRGRVTEIGNSPIQATASAAAQGQQQATNFKVVVTIEEPVPDIRPGFTATAEITTATRAGVVAVPIQALTVRDMLYDGAGTLVHEPPPQPRRRFFGGSEPADAVPVTAETPPGHTRRETEGVFLLRDGRAVFTPLTTGIAGERYFEVLTGAAAGDRVITGPFESVRTLADGAAVRLRQSPAAAP